MPNLPTGTVTFLFTMGDVAFTTAWAEGRAMTLEQAIEYALKGDEGASKSGIPFLLSG